MWPENLATVCFQLFEKSRRIAVIIASVTAILCGGIRFADIFADDVPKSDSPGKTANLNLEYRCRVIDKITRQSVSNARITVVRSVDKTGANRIIQETKHVTDANGFYELIISPEQLAMPDLHVSVDIEHDEYAARKNLGGLLAEVRAKEQSGGRHFFETTELCPGNAVSGTVISPDGKPLVGIKVRVASRPIPREPVARMFEDGTTDESGQFCLLLPQKTDSVLWIIPKDLAPIEKFLADKRGDLGTFNLIEGVRVNGLLKSIDGKPLKGVAVRLDYAGPREARVIPVATNLRRGAISDAEGRFEFDPVAPGEYTVIPTEALSDPLQRNQNIREIPAVFVRKTITVKDDANTFSVAIQAIPHVVVSGQCRGNRGDRNARSGVHVYGQLDGVPWNTTGHANQQGEFSVRIPHGLQRARAQAIVTQDQVVRFRAGKGEPLKDTVGDFMELGTINDDVSDIEIVYFKSPSVLVSAVDEDQNPVPGFQVAALYPAGKQRYLIGGMRSDIIFRNESDGRYRTRRMLPDEEATFKLTAPGFEAAEKTIKLAEGESKELVVVMKKQKNEDSNVDRQTK